MLGRDCRFSGRERAGESAALVGGGGARGGCRCSGRGYAGESAELVGGSEW